MAGGSDFYNLNEASFGELNPTIHENLCLPYEMHFLFLFHRGNLRNLRIKIRNRKCEMQNIESVNRSRIAPFTRTVASPKGVVFGFEGDSVFGSGGFPKRTRHLVEAS